MAVVAPARLGAATALRNCPYKTFRITLGLLYQEFVLGIKWRIF